MVSPQNTWGAIRGGHDQPQTWSSTPHWVRPRQRKSCSSGNCQLHSFAAGFQALQSLALLFQGITRLS